VKTPDDIVADVAGAILDGAPIDWLSVELEAGDTHGQVLEQLRVLSTLAELHRRIQQPEASCFRSTTTDNVVMPGQWGPLRVLEPIGRGSFGTVYRAWDTRLDREVALKLQPGRSAPESADATSVIHEGRLLARVRHPNVVAVYGAERIENWIGLWMEFIRGETLEQAIERGRAFSVEEATNIGIELCKAVAAVHGAELLHRDIKAHNVALADDGRVLLMDFGAGRELAEGPSSDFTGTPLYLAPEIFGGADASVRSDIYSLGVVLYHLVTRSYPVPGRNVKEIREKHRRGERVPVREVRSDLPDGFIEVVERAIAPSPEARFDTAADMMAALSATVAAPVETPRALMRFGWLGGAAALVALVVGLAPAMLLRSSVAPHSGSSEWTQITNFADSAVQPALSPDGRMLTFISGSNAFQGPGQIYVKHLPDGEPMRLTNDRFNKMSPVFSPDGSHIAYTMVDPSTFRWDTQIVPVQGTDAPRQILNASGLTWIDRHRLLFSEIKDGIHMALVTASESRPERRDVYVPPHERGMAHRSALSPDGDWVLAAEMENQAWLPCRLLPFDGHDRGKPIGPPGAPCTEAAWSRDGRWMYVNVNSDGNFHIWRQRFPDGQPDQVTFGPTDETGLAMASDGRSLVTSVGITTSSIWIHDRRGERPISTDGNAALPGLAAVGSMPRGSYFSPDDQKLYYLIRRTGGGTRLDGELWVVDLVSGRSERVLPGFTIASFDISDDGKRVVFAAAEADKPRLWIASVAGEFAPRKLSETDDDHPMFASNGEIVFRASEGSANFIYTMKEDGTGRRKIVPTPILALNSVSPDGRWVLAIARVSGDDVTASVLAYPTDGRRAVRVCNTCKVSWSRDGRRWYLSDDDGRTYVIDLRENNSLPDLPALGIRSAEDVASLSVLQTIQQPFIAPGRSEGTYASMRMTSQRNLYRIPLP
jgi:serine/threonine protein kinase/WD40 repeat protein